MGIASTETQAPPRWASPQRKLKRPLGGHRLSGNSSAPSVGIASAAPQAPPRWASPQRQLKRPLNGHHLSVTLSTSVGIDSMANVYMRVYMHCRLRESHAQLPRLFSLRASAPMEPRHHAHGRAHLMGGRKGEGAVHRPPLHLTGGHPTKS